MFRLKCESFIEQSNTKYGNSLVQIKNALK